MTFEQQISWIALGAGALMVALWLVQLWTKDAGIVDVGWAASLACAAIFVGWTGTGAVEVRILAGALGALWGFRLAWHLLTDRILRGEEDGRYQMLRENTGRWQEPVLLVFYLIQAGFVVALAVPFALASATAGEGLRWFHIAAALLWIVGFVGESTADRQLKAFKADPASSGRTCRSGLWRYSRHPNYFFEWLMWCAFGVLSLGAPHGWIGLLAPAFLLLLILKVTGIPPTEARALRSRGDDYRRYQRETSAFVPWFPKELQT